MTHTANSVRFGRQGVGDSLLACLMMICSNGPSLDQKEEVEKHLLAVFARFKVFKKRVTSNSFVGKRPQRASASKVKSSVLSELSGLENVPFEGHPPGPCEQGPSCRGAA
jgi:hypothetical protein